jgi:hypothetical protein
MGELLIVVKYETQEETNVRKVSTKRVKVEVLSIAWNETKESFR